MNRRAFIRTSGVAALTAVTSRAKATRSERRIRIAQIGVRHAHAPAKWETLRRLKEDFDVVGIWEPDRSERKKAQVRREYRGARWLSEQELYSDPSIEAVAIEVELPDLLTFARRSLKAGWHTHLDKPPGRDLTRFAKLQVLAAKQGCVLQLGYMYRYHPAFRFTIDLARAGGLGRILAIHGDIGSEMSVERRPWLAANYGGSMLLLGCHLVDLAVAILGEPNAVTMRRLRSFPQRDDYYDNEVALLEYSNTLVVIRSLNFEVGGGARRQFVVLGETGTVEIRPLEPARVRLVLNRPSGSYSAGTHEVNLPAVTGRYDSMMSDFAVMIRGRPSVVPFYNPEHDLAVHRTVLASA